MRRKKDFSRQTVSIAHAVRALPESRRLVTYLQRDGATGGTFAYWSREDLINLLAEHHDIDISGPVMLSNGYGLAVYQKIGWLYIQTKPKFCPLCQGSKVIAKDKWSIMPDITCPVCGGAGEVLFVGKEQKTVLGDMVEVDNEPGA